MLIEKNDLYGTPNQRAIRPKEGSGANEDIIIRFNKIHDNLALNGQDGGGIFIFGRYQRDQYIYGNFVYNNHTFGIAVADDSEDIYIWSNIVNESHRNSIDVWTNGYTEPLRVTITNNTVSRSDSLGYGQSKTRGGIAIRAGSGHVVKNNIMYNNRPSEPDGKHNQFGGSVSISQLEHNTTYHLKDNAKPYYYNGAMRSLAEMQRLYSKEDNFPAGKTTDPGFNDPNGRDNIHGTADDDFTLDGTHVDNGADLSQCFSIKIQDVYYRPCLDDALDPSNTDWTTHPPNMKVATVKQDKHGTGWERGAYVYRKTNTDNQENLSAPTGLKIQ
jgi:hypothetical protein